MTALALGALVACVGVLLAAFESPFLRDNARIEKVSLMVIVALPAAGVLHAIRVIVIR